MTEDLLQIDTTQADTPRRIDVTIDRLDKAVAALPSEQQVKLAGPFWPWWSIVVTVCRLRSMERGELQARGRALETMADAYDRVIRPGDDAVAALLKTFNAVYGAEVA